VAFGFGATTSLINQMMFGSSSMTYVMPGITSTLSKNRQSGTIYYVTSDANGNLAVTNTPVPDTAPSGDSAPAPSGDLPMATTTAITERTSNTVPERTVPGEGGIDESVIGSNLTASTGSTTRTLGSNSNAVQSILAETAVQDIAANSAAIEVNRQEIARNAQRIDQAFNAIDANSTAIQANALQISDLEEGLAAVAALPDMYLSPGANWSASGGLSAVGDEVGFGATMAIRGDDNWSFGASVGMAGDEATGKVQVRFEKF